MSFTSMHSGCSVSRLLRSARTANEQSDLSYQDSGYMPEQHSMYVAELNYKVAALRWLDVMPSLQYFKNPDPVRQVDNYLVLRMQIQTRF